MVDATLINEVREMYETGVVAEKPENAFKVFELIKQFIATNKESKEELEDMDLIIAQFDVVDEDFKYWLKLGEGIFDYGKGVIDEATFSMIANQETLGGLLSGEIDGTSAYMSGDLKIEGNLQDAIAYGEFLAMVMELFRKMVEE